MSEKLIFKTEISEIKKVREFFVKNASKELKISEFFNFEIVIGEVITNIIKYGCNNEIRDVIFEIEVSKTDVFMSFEYEGDNITEEEVMKYKELKREYDVFNIKESGRGTFIINSIMDRVNYIQNGKMAKIKLYKKIENKL